MFDQYPQFAPLTIDPQQRLRPPAGPGMFQAPAGGMNPMFHPGGLPDPAAAQAAGPAAIQPQANDALSRYNQFLARKSGGTLNLDPSNPSAGIQGWAQGESVPGNNPAPGTFLEAPAPVAPPAAPKAPLGPSSSGYIDFHASSMGTTPDRLRQMLGANPELGEMMARADASRNLAGEQGANMQSAAGGDPMAIARILNPGQGGMGLTGGQNARVLDTMNRQNVAGLEGRRVGALEKEVEIKKTESDTAQRVLAQKERNEIAAEIAERQKLFGTQESVDVSRAKVEQIRGMRPGASLVSPSLSGNAPAGSTTGSPAAATGPIPGLPPAGQQTTAGPAMRPELEALLSNFAAGLAPGLNGKPGMSLPDLLVAYNKQNAASPGFGANNLKAMTSFINSKYGENALISHLSGGGRVGGEIEDAWNHLGVPSERTAAEDVFRDSLGIQRGRSVVGDVANMMPPAMLARWLRGQKVLVGPGG